MRHAAHRMRVLQPQLLLLLLLAAAEGCTVLQFTEHAFSANTERLLRALPLFDGINGTLYLDTALSTHKCYPNGGWQDYFELGSHAEPWTPAKEKAGKEVCARYSLGQIDEVLQQVGMGWEELMMVGVRRVWKFQPWMRVQLMHAMHTLETAPRPTIAFHIKGGGHTPVQKHLALTPRDYVQLFVDAFPDVKNGTCIFAGGDEKLNLEAQTLALRAIGCRPLDRTPLHHREGVAPDVPETSSLYPQCLATRNLLTDLELLSHADYFVGTQKSGLSPIIETLRWALYGKQRRTFLTAGGDWYQRVRDFFRQNRLQPDLDEPEEEELPEMGEEEEEELPLEEPEEVPLGGKRHG